MVTNEIEIKMLEPEDEKDFLKFMEKHLGNWKKFKKLWNWRRNSDPGLIFETALLAKAKGLTVGCVGIAPALITLRGLQIKASWQQDSLVSPSMRGKGLGKRLVNKASESWDMVVAKGTSKPMHGLRKSLGFTDVPNSNYLLWVSKPRPMFNGLKKLLIENILCLWKTILPTPKRNRKISVQSIHSFDQSLNILADKLADEKVLRPYKGKNYLNIRYCECPGKQYKILKTMKSETTGAIVLSTIGPHLDEGWIVDMICSSKDKKSAYALLFAAMEYFKKQNIARIWVFATLSEARRWLYRFGFVATGISPKFTYRIQGHKINPAIIANTSWDFWHGDGDLELYD